MSLKDIVEAFELLRLSSDEFDSRISKKALKKAEKERKRQEKLEQNQKLKAQGQ